MSMEQYIRAIAGSFVLASLALGYLVSPYWYLFTVFVGANLLQSAFTKWCLMENILEGLGCRAPSAVTPVARRLCLDLTPVPEVEVTQ